VAGAKRKDPDAGGWESIESMVRGAAEAQERSLEAGQQWAEDLLSTFREQAESYGSLLRAIDASLRAMERAITSQAETTRAMAESLEASSSVIGAAMEAQRRSVEHVEAAVGGTVSLLSSQLQALRSQLEVGQGLVSGATSEPVALFLKMTREWTDAYSRLLGAAPPSGRRTTRE
jgi:hypothetical protein